MKHTENSFNESLKFVAKHYKQAIFNPDNAWHKITGKKSYALVRPAIFLRIASAAIILIAIGFFYYNSNKITTVTAQNISTFAKLPDQSEITLQPGAKLSYDNAFNKNVRNVSMEGEISFNISHNKLKPFTVHTQNTQIKVIGTVFDVKSNDISTELNVISGKVRFTPDSIPVSFECTKNMYAKYNCNSKHITVGSPLWNCSITKKSNTIQFKNTPLNEVCSILNQYYNAEIRLSKQNENLKLTTTFQNKNINEIITIINLTLDTNITNTL